MTRKKTGSALAPKRFVPCTLRQLPTPLRVLAAKTAAEINPSNAPPPGAIAKIMRFLAAALYPHLGEEDLPELEPHPLHIAILTTKYWGTGGKVIPTYFMDTQDSTLKNKLLAAFNSWGDNVVWVESSLGNSLARIAFTPGEGYYSYLGSDYAHIPQNQCTLNLDSWTLGMPDSEWLRVPPHEAGHGRGFPHEHMRPELVDLLDVEKTVAYFAQDQGWSRQEVMDQVLTPLSDRDILGTPVDQDSAMCYQLPGSITKNGQPIRGGTRINDTDRAFAQKMYPRSTPPAPPPGPPTASGHILYLDFHHAVPAKGLVGPFHTPVAIHPGRTELIYPAAPGSAPAAAGNDSVSVSP